MHERASGGKCQLSTTILFPLMSVQELDAGVALVTGAAESPHRDLFKVVSSFRPNRDQPEPLGRFVHR